MKQENFVNYKNWRYAKLAIVILVASVFYYFFDSPLTGRKGNSYAGMFFGILSTLGILYLTYFGIRKRSYRYGAGSLVGTLSAHVWLGVILLLLVPLHSGLNFNLNFHTLTYIVMVVVVLSGIFGAVAYRIFPQYLLSQRGKEKQEELISAIEKYDSKIKAQIAKHQAIDSLVNKYDLSSEKYISTMSCLKLISEIDQKSVARLISSLPEQIRTEAVATLTILVQKREVLKKLTNELRASSLLKLWLYFHVPCTILLLILLCAHIFSVFYYWT